MPIVNIFKLDEERAIKIRQDVISGEMNILKKINFVEIEIEDENGENKKETIRYMPVISGLTEDNNLNILSTSVILDHEFNLTPYTKKNIDILRCQNGKITKIYFNKDGNSIHQMGVEDDFYVTMTYLKSREENGENDEKIEEKVMEIDKVVLSRVLFFCEVAIGFKERLYVFNKYNHETNEYEEKESLLYISLSDDNFEEKLTHVLSLPEYKMVRPIEFENVLVAENDTELQMMLFIESKNISVVKDDK